MDFSKNTFESHASFSIEIKEAVKRARAVLLTCGLTKDYSDPNFSHSQDYTKTQEYWLHNYGTSADIVDLMDIHVIEYKRKRNGTIESTDEYKVFHNNYRVAITEKTNAVFFPCTNNALASAHFTMASPLFILASILYIPTKETPKDELQCEVKDDDGTRNYWFYNTMNSKRHVTHEISIRLKDKFWDALPKNWYEIR